MNWRDGFLQQARSDFAMLNKLGADAAIPHCHRLHYLQMAAEKLSKAMLHHPQAKEPPVFTHAAFRRMLQILKSRPDVRRRLGFADSAAFKQYIDSLLPMADKIEDLAPAIAGASQPNAEYPWRDSATGRIVVPASFDFRDFSPRKPQMVKLIGLLRHLLAMSE
jgi:hypothetical protein